jgi:RimJ/RimL family protein N-acetyltransferase
MSEFKLTEITTAPVLETDRLTLRAHRLTDFDAFAAMRRDPEDYRLISGVPSTGEESWSRLLRYRGHWAMLGFGYWVVEAKDDGRYMGEVGLANYRRDIDPPLDNRPEAGWSLVSTEHGKGHATEAMRRVLTWADESLDAPEIVAIFNPNHTVSVRVARKLGFVEEGMARYKGEPTLVMVRRRG